MSNPTSPPNAAGAKQPAEKPIPTPEIDKMRAVKHQSQAIGEFLEWLQSEKGWEIAGRDTRGRLECVSYSTEKLLAEHFGIDLDKVDDEKRALLDQLRGGAK